MQIKVRVGQSLSTLALRYNTTVGAIAQANHIADPNKIQIGQRLEIPGANDKKLGHVCKMASTDSADFAEFRREMGITDADMGETPTPAPAPRVPARAAAPTPRPRPVAPAPAAPHAPAHVPLPTPRPAPVANEPAVTPRVAVPVPTPRPGLFADGPAPAPRVTAPAPTPPQRSGMFGPDSAVNTQARVSPARNLANLSSVDKDALVRAVAAEARGESPAVWAGVAQTIINYSRQSGQPIPQLVRTSYLSSNFDGNRGFYTMPLSRIPNEAGIRNAVDRAADFRSAVGNRTHFHDTSIKTPSFGDRSTRVQVGHMVFFNAH